MKVVIESWNSKLILKVEIRRWNWKLKLIVEMKNLRWELKINQISTLKIETETEN